MNRITTRTWIAGAAAALGAAAAMPTMAAEFETVGQQPARVFRRRNRQFPW